MKTEAMKVEAGMQVTIRGLSWSAGWEFDCPTAIISPVLRCYEDGRSLEDAAEDLLIDACINRSLKTEPEDAWAWRGWSMAYLKRQMYRPHVERLVAVAVFKEGPRHGLAWDYKSFEEIRNKRKPLAQLKEVLR